MFRINRHRQIMEPEVLEESSEEEQEEEQEEEEDEGERMDTEETINSNRVKMEIESSDDDGELNEEEIVQRRQRFRLKAKEREEVRISPLTIDRFNRRLNFRNYFKLKMKKK